MADDVLAEALARLEHKVDALMRHHKVVSQPMHFPGQSCPACNSFIDYQVDIVKGVVVRRCQCSTGKIAPTIPLVPVQQGAPNGSPSSSQDLAGVIGEALSQNSPGRKAR